MKRFAAFCGILAWSVFLVSGAYAAESGDRRVNLPKPVITGGMPLMNALAARASARTFSDKPVSEQTLSNLLWATWGVNRKDGRRTAPTAKNRQEIQLYVALESGVWRYDGKENRIVRVLAEDMRGKFGGAPVTLVYAAPSNEMTSGMHAGSLYQNAGLYCASEGLANVVKTSGRDALKGMLELPVGYEVLVVQSIGWPQ